MTGQASRPEDRRSSTPTSGQEPSMSDKPISDLRRRMIADMTIRTFGAKTQHDYIRHVEAFARFLGSLRARSKLSIAQSLSPCRKKTRPATCRSIAGRSGSSWQTNAIFKCSAALVSPPKGADDVFQPKLRALRADDRTRLERSHGWRRCNGGLHLARPAFSAQLK
jgi:hypothetical protein